MPYSLSNARHNGLTCLQAARNLSVAQMERDLQKYRIRKKGKISVCIACSLPFACEGRRGIGDVLIPCVFRLGVFSETAIISVPVYVSLIAYHLFDSVSHMVKCNSGPGGGSP